MPQKRTKEPVRLRMKALSDGSQSLYLDIYVNGVRRYEFLKMYLIPEKTKADKSANKETLRLAEAVKALRVIDLQNNRYGFEERRERVLFRDYMSGCVAEKMKRSEKGTWRTWYSTAIWADKSFPKNVAISDVAEDDCRRFCELLAKSGLKDTSQKVYISTIKAVFNRAVKENVIAKSPFAAIDVEGVEMPQRLFLTKDELSRMAKTPCMDDLLRRAFLFSCLTGLRWSDIEKLTWAEVNTVADLTRIVFNQKKTGNLEYLDINAQAASLMGERQSPKARVFEGMKYGTSVSPKLRKWAKDAGVDKEITFHSGRHTFAVMMIDLGVDIYTVQKLLGHREISTTQIYAEVLDKRKVDAVNKIPDLL